MADEKDQELINVVALLARGFEIEGVQLLDAETNEPVNLRELIGSPKTPLVKWDNVDFGTMYRQSRYIELRQLERRLIGKPETTDNSDGTFTHTFKFQ